MTIDLDAGATLERMKEVTGCKTDKELGDYFGSATSTVSNWRSRNRIPIEECITLSVQKGISLDWLVFGISLYEKDSPTRPVSEEVALDPRAARIIQFVTLWSRTRNSDEMAWLEQHLRRTVAEYAEWAVGRE